MKAWRGAPLVVIDTETTGTDVVVARVVEVAAYRRIDGTSWSALINPKQPIPPECTAVHGITDADVRCERTFGDVADLIDKFVGTNICVAFNARFDRGILISEYLRAGFDVPVWLRSNAHWIDPLVWARHRDPYAKGAGRHKLGAVAERLGVTPGTAHRALGDCETTAAVLAKLAAEPGLMPDDFDELIMKQRILAAENEASFLRWKSTQPKKDAA